MPTNILFGFEETDWSTTTGAQYEATKSSLKTFGKGHFTEKVNPDNKTVHWKLGNDKPQYSTSNQLPDPRDAFVEPTESNKKDIKKTNYVLGFDKVDYAWKKGASIEEINRFTEQHIESKEAEANSRSSKSGNNIVWGFDKPEMRSEACSKFVNHNSFGQSREERDRIKTFVRNLKKTGVSFGHDKVDYSTTNRLPAHDAVARGQTGNSSSSSKAAQQKSSIVLGYEKNNYATTTKSFF